MPKLRMSYGRIEDNQPSEPQKPGKKTGRGFFVRLKQFYQKNKKTIRYAVIGGAVFCLGFVIWVGKDLPDPDRLEERVFEQSTRIYDRTGEKLLYEIYTDKKRTIIELDQIPKYLIDGVIATEDTKFYEHQGIRPLSIARSFVNGLLGKGRIGGGASTLTQQLVKNAILTDERTLTRKAKELILAVWLEQKYTKDEILKIYFNEIPYGSTNYGVETAAQSYFNKKTKDLTLAEAATLAGLPQLPTYYLNNLDALKTRRNFVLQRMVDEGYLQKEEADKAKQEELVMKKTITRMEAPHFVKYVQQQLIDEYGENTVGRGGLKVITTLDWDKQKFAEKAVQEKGEALLKEGGADNAALLALDPKTAQIIAMVGSRDFYDEKIDGQFNVTTQARRQPGSSIKPIVYAAAFAKGYTPSTVLYDVVTPFGVDGIPYTPQNYDLSERGPVTLRSALQGSLNIPAVKTLYLVGIKQAIQFSEKLGYTTFSEKNIGLSLVLGGGEVKMLEHVNAYGVLANNGKKYEPVSVLKIEDNRGKVLYEWKEVDGDQVISPEVAAITSNVLSDDASRAYVFGANSALTLPGRPVAAKTGTTNSYVDAWVVGYTPSLVAGVWAGNSNNTPMKQGYGGGRVAGQIWNYFMRESLKGSPIEKFPNPPANKSTKPILNGGAQGAITAMVNKYTNRLATSSTPESYIVTRTYLTPHDILHYVDKDDPQGPIPKEPNNDPAYAVWEKAVQNWIARKKEKEPTWEISFSEPPTEYDDEASLEAIPELEILSPTAGEQVKTRNLEFRVNARSTRGVVKVVYRIDGRIVGVSTDAPFTMNYEAQTLSPGEHILEVVAADDMGNQTEQSIPFILDVVAENAGVYFDGMSSVLQRSKFPVSVFLRPYKTEEIEKITIFGRSPQNNQIVLFETTDIKNNMFDNSLVFVWKIPPTDLGVWNLSAQVEVKNQGVRVSDTALVTIQN